MKRLKHGYVTHGDAVVITAGVPVGEAGTTNLMKVHIIGDLLARGQGIGKASVIGKSGCGEKCRRGTCL